MTKKEKELNALKCKIGEMLGWDIRDFELIRSGMKGGRPNWEVEHHSSPIGQGRYAFTAFDADDIHGLHEVRC